MSGVMDFDIQNALFTLIVFGVAFFLVKRMIRRESANIRKIANTETITKFMKHETELELAKNRIGEIDIQYMEMKAKVADIEAAFRNFTRGIKTNTPD